MGAVVIHTHMLKNAFDILVMYRGKTHLVEIKDGSKSPSKRKLTPGEEKCKSEVESVGVKYNVVESIDQAIELVQKSAEC